MDIYERARIPMISANWPAWSNQLMGGTAPAVGQWLRGLPPVAMQKLLLRGCCRFLQSEMNHYGTGVGCHR